MPSSPMFAVLQPLVPMAPTLTKPPFTRPGAWARLIVRAVVLFGVLVVVSGCGDDRRETGRLTSPDSRDDALVVDVSGGATEPFVFEVYVVARRTAAEGWRCRPPRGGTRNAKCAQGRMAARWSLQ